MMATLARKSFDEYCALLDANKLMATKGFEAKIAKAVQGFANAKTEQMRGVYRDVIISEIYTRIDIYQAIAQTRADDMFQAITGRTPSKHASFPYEAADARVRSAATHIFGHQDKDAFVHALVAFIKKEVGAAANIAMAENVEEANKK